MFSNDMKKFIIFTFTVILLLLAGAYYYVSSKEYVIRIPESDLQRKFEERLPLTQTYFFFIQITLKNPRVHLENGSRRVKAGLDVVFNASLDNNPRPIGGIVDVSGGVLYSADKGQFFLTNPLIDRLELQGVPQQYVEKFNVALTQILADYYAKNPIYTLHATDAKQAVARMVLKDVIVENSALVITLGI